ncbi:MAG: NPCBM/NEW2 domain-containing protein [Pleurocapsa sp. MO_226.B13]|nr:NPCBM/NEW2 domain-containing protein [Pleurocapsa sp. MO_226.B13]
MTTIEANRQTTTRVILLIIGLLFLGYCLLTVLPWEPTAYGFHLDASWASAVHVAFKDRIQFGRDFIYTYGPYGFLRVARNFFPETYGYGFGFSILIAIAVWAGLFRLVRYCVSRGDGSLIFLIPLLGFFPNQILSIDSFQFPIIILPLVLYFYVSKRMSPALVLTIINAALSSLTKHTYLLLCITFMVLITIDELGKLKRVPQVAPVYLAFLWLFWVFAAQDLANVPAYIINGLEIVRGFSAVMGIAGPVNEVILYVLATGIFLLSIGIVEARNRGWWGMLPTLGLAAILFITFKGAFTRHDTHALQALFNVTPVMLIFTAVLWSSIKSSVWRVGKQIKLSLTLLLGTSALLMTVLGSIILNHYFNYGYGIYSLEVVEHNTTKLTQVIKVLSGKEDFQAIATQGKTYIQTRNPLSAVSGTVDLYPNEIATIFAYDLPYKPRPVIQSFSAYTSKLARLNAQHLKQPDAPEAILFDLKPIDGHLASFEDGLSWPEILTLYEITNIEGRYLVMQRSSQPRQYQLEPLTEEVDLAFNQWFDVSNTQEPVWAKIELHPNLLGKLTTAALRLPPLYIEIETADGIKTRYRTIGDVMSEGFLLSPTLSNRWDFLDFAVPDWQDKLNQKQVTRFRIINEGFNSRLYPQTYQLSLSQLQFTRQSFAQIPGWQEWSSQLIPKPLDGGLQRIDEINGEDKTGWMAHAPMKMQIDLEQKTQSFSFSFGILDEGVENALKENEGDGVEFRISAWHADGREEILFDRKLQPRSKPEDRGIQQGSIDLSQVDASKLIVETVPGEDNRWDWSYWSQLRVD